MERECPCCGKSYFAYEEAVNRGIGIICPDCFWEQNKAKDLINEKIEGMEGNKFVNCLLCEGAGVLHELDGEEFDCPVCEGEGGDFENYRQLES